LPSIVTKACAGGVGLVPVALHHLRAVHDDLAGLALRQFLQGVGVDHTRVDVEEGHAQALLLGPVGRVAVRGGHGLGHAVAFAVLQAQQLLQRLRHGLGHGGAAAGNAAQAGQVVVLEPRVGHEVDHHRGDQAPCR
jgi:hypothetical protein